MTSEHPADHPHHNSFWFAADHVYCRLPVTHGKGYEDYTYNIYLNDTFQGRAPGRIVETAYTGMPEGDAFRIVQTLDWRGPSEWAAPDGRLAARETRTLLIRRQAGAHVIDVQSTTRGGRLGLHAWADAPRLFQCAHCGLDDRWARRRSARR